MAGDSSPDSGHETAKVKPSLDVANRETCTYHFPRSSTPISDSNLDKETLASSEIIVLHTLAQDNAAIAYGTPESGTEEDITCYIENVSAYEFIRAKSSQYPLF